MYIPNTDNEPELNRSSILEYITSILSFLFEFVLSLWTSEIPVEDQIFNTNALNTTIYPQQEVTKITSSRLN